MNKLYINAKRNGYDEEQTGNTMTIGELIEVLEDLVSYTNLSLDTPIYLCNDNGYTYGNINSYDLYAGENWDNAESIDNLM